MPKFRPGLLAVLALVFVSPGFALRENHELTMARLYYEEGDYDRACVHFQNLILRPGEAGLSGDALYGYARSHEQAWGLDARARGLYRLSLFYYRGEGQGGGPSYAAAGLKGGAAPDEQEAAVLLRELREDIVEERKARFYRGADWLYDFFSRFSLFQWKIIVSLAMTLPLFIGILILSSKRPRRPPEAGK
jgi:tetratricopeptide (TPR) repeat protein